MFCSKCGNEMKEGEKFCSKCGNEIEQEVKENSNEEAILSAKQALEKILRNPNSTKYNSIEVLEKDNYNRYLVELDVSSENGFGGVDRNIFFVVVKYVSSKKRFEYYTNKAVGTDKETVKKLNDWKKIIYCTKCGNEINKEEKFCSKCGKKQSKIKNLSTNNKIALLMIAICVILIFILNILYNTNYTTENNSTSNSSEEQENNIEVEEFVGKIYELNEVGLWRGENIIDEEYNQNGDLISYKYLDSDDVEQEVKLYYEYDSLNRVIKISKESGPYVTINYEGEENKIESIDNYLPGLLTRYTFYYSDDEYPKIIKSSYNELLNSDNNLNYAGCILFEEVELNGKEYVLSIETDENDNITSEKINLKEDINSESIFDILEIAPLEYWEGELYNIEGNLRGIILDTIISLDFGKIISHGKVVYSNEDEEKNIYDNNNRIIYKEQVEGVQYFYKYNTINDNEYEYSIFAEVEDEDVLRAANSNLTEEEIEKYGGLEQTYKIYTDETGQVIKIEELTNEEMIEKEEIDKKLQEYQEYIDNNKVDTSTLNFDNLENELVMMKNNGGVEYSITNNLNNEEDDEETEELDDNSDSIDNQTSNNSTSSIYNEEEVSSNENIESESERVARQEIDSTNVRLYIEYTKNGEGYYRSSYYNLISDIEEINELVSNNEPIQFSLNCNYPNFTLTIKETGQVYTSGNIPNTIPFIEGNNTIIVEMTNKYGYSRTVSNTINVNKLGVIK